MKRLLIATMVVSLLGGPVARGASPSRSTRWNFFASGYVCIQKSQWLIVDVDAQPTCAGARGIPLGVVSGAVPPVVQQGRWRVSRTPVFVSGTLSVDLAAVRSTRTAAPRRDRYAESLATVEVASFEQSGATSGTAAARSRNTVFAALPDFASIAPGATVRTARLATADGHRFGAQIRDASITSEQRTALELKSIELGVPVVVNPTPSRPLGTDCAGPGALAQPNGVGSTTATAMLNDRTSRAKWLNQVGTAPVTRVDEPVGCDESTQVRIVRAAVVGPLVANGQLDQRVDTVLDATLWLLPATR